MPPGQGSSMAHLLPGYQTISKRASFTACLHHAGRTCEAEPPQSSVQLAPGAALGSNGTAFIEYWASSDCVYAVIGC
jgi:hypothetical protein